MTTPQLRDLIQDKHKEAENHRFAQYLLSGEATPKVYADYLYNQHLIYKALELKASRVGLLSNLKGIERAELILDDFNALEFEGSVKKYITTLNYERYINSIPEKNIMAHIYVRHFGDMYGGAIMKTKVPGSGTMYKFDNKNDLIQKIRSTLTPEMAEEANIVFDYAIGLFEELANEHNIPETN